MITKQEVDIDGDKIRLRNTFDIAAAKEAAHEATQEGDSRKATYKCMVTYHLKCGSMTRGLYKHARHR